MRIFKCIKCGNSIEGWPPGSCGACGNRVERREGIYIFSDEGNLDITSEDRKYVGYDIIAPGYDLSRDRCMDSTEGEVIGGRLGAGKTVLEIGAGTGYHSIPMAKACCKVIAGDISMNMLRILVSKVDGHLQENLLPCRMNAYSLPLEDNSVDAVLIDHVFHLLESPQKALGEINRVLKQRGHFINIHYSGETLSSDSEKDRYFEICKKAGEYYKAAAGSRGVRLIDSFGCYSQTSQQQYISEFFDKTEVVERKELSKESTDTIDNCLSGYRNRLLVNQAEINYDVNNRIMDEVEAKLKAEFGPAYKNISLKSRETTSVEFWSKKE